MPGSAATLVPAPLLLRPRAAREGGAGAGAGAAPVNLSALQGAVGGWHQAGSLRAGAGVAPRGLPAPRSRPRRQHLGLVGPEHRPGGETPSPVPAAAP